MSSIKDNLPVDCVIADVQQRLRDGTQRVLVLVENENDAVLYRPFFDEKNVVIQPPSTTHGGCRFFVTILSALAKYQSRLCAIKDADFDNLNNTRPSITNLFFTDGHDVEMMIFKDESIIPNVFNILNCQHNSQEILQSALDYLRPLSIIKWMNSIGDFNINFGVIHMNQCIDKVFSPSDWINFIYSVEPNSRPNVRVISMEQFDDFNNSHPDVDLFQLTNGHDVCDYLLSKITCPNKPSKTVFHNFLQLAYTSRGISFKNTTLYHEIRNWSISNNLSVLKNIAVR